MFVLIFANLRIRVRDMVLYSRDVKKLGPLTKSTISEENLLKGLPVISLCLVIASKLQSIYPAFNRQTVYSA